MNSYQPEKNLYCTTRLFNPLLIPSKGVSKDTHPTTLKEKM